MSKSKSNGTEVYDENVVIVSATTELPYSFIPYHTFERARLNHPEDKLYIFEGKYGSFKIVAFPVQMFKPKPEEEETNE